MKIKTDDSLLQAMNLTIEEFNQLILTKHGFQNNLDKYSVYWKEIQKYLPNGVRICPKMWHNS